MIPLQSLPSYEQFVYALHSQQLSSLYTGCCQAWSYHCLFNGELEFTTVTAPDRCASSSLISLTARSRFGYG